MPVRKFRSAAEMNQPFWRTPGDPSLYRAIAALWRTWSRLRPRHARPGVYKFRSIEELDRATLVWRSAPTRK
jgi:hypothetical protein